MALLTFAEVKSYLGLASDDEDTRLAFLLTGVIAEINRYGRRSFDAVLEDQTFRDSGGAKVLVALGLPIVSVAKIEDVIEGEEITLTYAEVAEDAGLIRYRPDSVLENWPGARRDMRYQVTYSHGYADAPDDVKQAAMDYVVAKFERLDPTIVSNNEGGHAVSYKDAQTAMRTAIHPYRNLVL